MYEAMIKTEPKMERVAETIPTAVRADDCWPISACDEALLACSKPWASVKQRLPYHNKYENNSRKAVYISEFREQFCELQ
jgi:hypothetical protein